MADIIDSIGNQIESIALALVTMDGEDIPAMGEILNQLGEIKTQGQALGSDAFVALAGALEGYLEKVVLRETSDLATFENGLAHLQRYFHSLSNGVEDSHDLSPVFSQLGMAPEDYGDGQQCAQSTNCHAPDQLVQSDSGSSATDAIAATAAPAENLEHFEAPDPNPDEEDREIIAGFVMESLDGLETVEVNLMDMEENPDDSESINSIFRSFHTIKGVSAFLGFMRINKLAHRSENLLDKIRSGELEIRPQIVDVILDSVDMLKQLIYSVKAGLEDGTGMDSGLDIAELVARIEAVQDMVHERRPIGQIMIEQGALDQEDLNRALDTQKATPDKKLA